jgi:hypothetical protein
MPHRELRDWERCAKNPFLSAHVWEYQVVREQGEEMVSGVRCKLCQAAPPPAEEGRMAMEFELQQKRNRLARGLHNAQKAGTGTQIAGRKPA